MTGLHLEGTGGVCLQLDCAPFLQKGVTTSQSLSGAVYTYMLLMELFCSLARKIIGVEDWEKDGLLE